MDHKHNDNNEHCCKDQQRFYVTQNLIEMDFDRGIWSAALYNDVKRLKQLILKGQTDVRDKSGYTALHYAARSGNLEICNLLLDAGADINAITNGGATPLHRATMMGHLEIVKFFLSKNVKTDIQDSDGQTPLHRAALKGNKEIIEILLKHNPNLKTIKDNNGNTFYDIIEKNYPNLVYDLNK